MASSDHPEPRAGEDAGAPARTGIQASAETPSIPLAPLSRPPALSGEQFTRRRDGLDALLIFLVLVFAFLIASVPAANSDFFRQAAVGRLIVAGDYSFGVDPFSFAGDDVYSINHSWLFGLLVYLLFRIPTIGGIVVVIAKALLVTGLAEIMLRTSRRVGQSLWIPAACTALALLALSPRLLLQSTCLSFLFLALTLWLLQRSSRSWWWLPPLFALWANCDAWFFLGPLTVALYLLGEWIQRWLPSTIHHPPSTTELKTLSLVLLVGLAACLVNPHHVRVFTLPPELGLVPAPDLLDRDAQFQAFSLSPLHAEYYETYRGRSVAGLSYLPLMLAGLLSFVFLRGRAPAWRLLIWLAYALLSLYSARCIPFFAIVAGPITTLNWLDFAVRHEDAPRLAMGHPLWSLGGRVLTILVLLILLAATVPGWLQAQPYDNHRLGWRVVADPSLKQAAEQIHEWREQGKLPAEPRWFNMRPEMANYLAWFAPGERAFLDLQLPYFPAAADDYLSIRESLKQMSREESDPKNAPSAAERNKWRTILRDWRVRYWIFDNTSARTADLVASHVLFTSPNEWVPCSMHGNIAIFAWRDPLAKDESDPSEGLALDLQRLAFGANAEQAPPQGPETVEPRRDLWDQWLRPAPPLSLDHQTAGLYDLRFELLEGPRRVYHKSRAWQAAIAANALVPGLPQGPIPSSLLAWSWSCTYHDLFPHAEFQPARPLEPREQGAMVAWSIYVNSYRMEAPASLYLALRAARRALRDNPQDAHTQLLLGEMYARLNGQPYERSLKNALPLAAEIRRTQMTAAFQNCLRLQPPRAVAAHAHAALCSLFDQMHYRDAAAHHFRAWRDNRQAAGPKPNESAEQFAKELEGMSKELQRREEENKREQERYENVANKKPVLEKIAMALKSGLAETALAILEKASPDDLNGQKAHPGIGRDVAVLLLNLGLLDKVRELPMFDPETADDRPVSPEYLDLHLRLAAARGDYERADRLLADALNYAWKSPTGQPPLFAERMQIGATIGRLLLGEALHRGGTEISGTPQLPLPLPPGVAFWPPASYYVRRHWLLEAIHDGLAVGQQRGEWHLLRGWLAVESGRCVEARGYFQGVLDTVTPPSRWMLELNKLNKILLGPEVGFLQDLGTRQNIALSLSQQYLKWLDRK